MLACPVQLTPRPIDDLGLVIWLGALPLKGPYRHILTKLPLDMRLHVFLFGQNNLNTLYFCKRIAPTEPSTFCPNAYLFLTSFTQSIRYNISNI